MIDSEHMRAFRAANDALEERNARNAQVVERLAQREADRRADERRARKGRAPR